MSEPVSTRSLTRSPLIVGMMNTLLASSEVSRFNRIFDTFASLICEVKCFVFLFSKEGEEDGLSAILSMTFLCAGVAEGEEEALLIELVSSSKVWL